MDIVQSTLSHHMKVLTDNGVVTATRSGKWTIYSVNRPVLQEAAGRLEVFLKEAEHAEKSDIAARARITLAEEKVQEEIKKSLAADKARETDHGKTETGIEKAGGAELPASASAFSAGAEEQERSASTVEPGTGMREQAAGSHEPSGKKKGKKGKKSKKAGKK